jgi:hypothetical protein
MPTHYHLLVRLKTDELGKEIMQPLGVSYSKAINRNFYVANHEIY